MTRLFSPLLLLLFLLPVPAFAENMVRAELVQLEQSRVGVVLHHPTGWHTYYKDPGDAGIATELKWTLPEGFSVSEIEWPQPQKFAEGGLTTYGYTGDITLPVTITSQEKLAENTYNLKVKASWLVCKDICIPEEQDLSVWFSANEAASGNPPTTNNQQLTTNYNLQSTNYNLLITLTLALLGGLVLNFMPCVLPVLSLKALALVKKSGKAREHTAWHGITYTLGILASFAAIAIILLVLQKSGEAVGWGYQMQFPAFIAFLIYLLFAVGLSLSGAFHLPVLLGGVGGNLASEASLRGSFFTGVLATLVATPCTAPFMASAVGAALTLPPLAALLVFLALGLGLALPFLLISIFPSCLRFLPKQGEWMVRFKEFLAFPIYGSVIWLLWVLGLQAGMGAVAIVLCGMLLLIFALWLKRYHFPALLMAIIIMAATLVNLGKNEEAAATTAYSKQVLSELRQQGKAVYVDATAAWCITCQLNKRVVLENDNVKAAFAKNNVTLMIADWTRKNTEVTIFLHEFGYNGVPLNVFYPAGGGKPIILPQILTEKVVLEAISKNSGSN